MKRVTIILILFACFMINFVSALNVEFSCPANIENNKEFECSVKLTSFSGNYDIKVDISQNDNRISKILSYGEWKSTNYYVENYIFNESTKNVRLIVNGTGGVADGVLKLRKNETIQYQKNFSVFIVDKNNGNTQINQDNQTIIRQINNTNESIINLNSNVKEETIYESKNEKIKKYAIYGFCVFLLFIIIVLIITLWQRKKSEQ